MNYIGDEMDLKDIKKKVKKSMDKQRYDHTKGVMYTAGCLAMANEYPIDKAMPDFYMIAQNVFQTMRK